MGPLGKLFVASGLGAVAVELVLMWRKKHEITPMAVGQGYTVVLSFSGPGAGGPLAGEDLQNALDLTAAGVGTIRATSTSTDNAKKTITYAAGVTHALNATSDMLAPASIPSAWGTVSLDSVHNTGAMTLGPVAGTASS